MNSVACGGVANWRTPPDVLFDVVCHPPTGKADCAAHYMGVICLKVVNGGLNDSMMV